MIAVAQNELIEKLVEVRDLAPDVRFGQLLGFLVEDQTDRSLYDVEDADLLKVMEKHRVDLQRPEENE